MQVAPLRVHLQGMTLRSPRVPVLSNTGELLTESTQVMPCLLRQLVEPVQWSRAMEKVVEAAARPSQQQQHQPQQVVEVGAGTSLRGILHRINPDINIANVDST